MKIKKKLSIIHPYLENRREEIDLGLYPKHHLWGLAGLEREERCQRIWWSVMKYTFIAC